MAMATKETQLTIAVPVEDEIYRSCEHLMVLEISTQLKRDAMTSTFCWH
jgi:hypothetical protein